MYQGRMPVDREIDIFFTRLCMDMYLSNQCKSSKAWKRRARLAIHVLRGLVAEAKTLRKQLFTSLVISSRYDQHIFNFCSRYQMIILILRCDHFLRLPWNDNSHAICQFVPPPHAFYTLI